MTERQRHDQADNGHGARGRSAREHAGRTAPGWPAVILRVAGSGLLIATAAIHLDLYLTGYRTIPTIGWLFLLQVIAAFGLGLAVLVIPSRLVIASRLAAAAGAGLRPRHPRRLPPVGLDRAVRVQGGPHDGGHRRRRRGGGRFRRPGRARACSRRGERPGGRRGTRPRPGSPPRSRPRRQGGRNDRRGPGGCGAGAVRAGAWPGPAPRHPRQATGTGRPEDHDDRRDDGTDQRQGLHALLVRPRHPDHVEVLRQLRRVLAPGDRHRRRRRRACRARSARSSEPTALHQLTYNGHPLYTYIGDTAPGQARGNNLNLNGGVWHEVTTSG